MAEDGEIVEQKTVFPAEEMYNVICGFEEDADHSIPEAGGEEEGNTSPRSLRSGGRRYVGEHAIRRASQIELAYSPKERDDNDENNDDGEDDTFAVSPKASNTNNNMSSAASSSSSATPSYNHPASATIQSPQPPHLAEEFNRSNIHKGTFISPESTSGLSKIEK